MPSSEITHKGRIVDITPEYTTVEIVSTDACRSCHAKGLCGVDSGKVKAVQLPTRGWDSYAPGDEVTLTLKASMGHKAVWLAYVIPLVILLAVLLSLVELGAGELASALCALGAVAVYYFVIFLLRERLRNEYIFNIQR